MQNSPKPPDALTSVSSSLPDEHAAELVARGIRSGGCRSWRSMSGLSGRIEQYPRDATEAIWLVTGGRGSGKTRLGAEWVDRIGARPTAFHGRAGAADLRADRAGRRHAGRRARGDDRRAVRHRDDRARQPAATTSRRGAGWCGRTARWRTSSRRRTRRACAGRSSTRPGATSSAKWKNAEATLDMLQFGLAARRRGRGSWSRRRRGRRR